MTTFRATVYTDIRRVVHPALFGVMLVFIALFFVDLKNSFNYAVLQSTAGIESLDFAAKSSALPCFKPSAIDIGACTDPSQRSAATANVNMAVNSSRLGEVARRLRSLSGMVEFTLHELSTGWGLALVTVLVAVTTGLQTQNFEQNRARLTVRTHQALTVSRISSVLSLTVLIAIACSAIGCIWIRMQGPPRTDIGTTQSVRFVVAQGISAVDWGDVNRLIYRIPFTCAVLYLYASVLMIASWATASIARSLAAGALLLGLLNALATLAPVLSINAVVAGIFRMGQYFGLHDVRSWKVPWEPAHIGVILNSDVRTWSVSMAVFVVELAAVSVLVLRNSRTGFPDTK